MDRFGQFFNRWRRMSFAENPVIVSVNRTEVSSVEEYQREIARVAPGDIVSLLVYDPAQRNTVPVSVPLPSAPR
jgi:S1-C subfamily serine protease